MFMSAYVYVSVCVSVSYRVRIRTLDNRVELSTSNVVLCMCVSVRELVYQL